MSTITHTSVVVNLITHTLLEQLVYADPDEYWDG